MTARIVDRPYVFPGKALWGETVGPMVDMGSHPAFDGNVYLTPAHVWEAVRVGFELLTDGQREELVGLCGGSSASEREELFAEIEKLKRRCSELKASASVPLADVIDFATEKARIELERARAQSEVPA